MTLSPHPELADLVSAEDFLDYFGIPYDPKVVQVNRLQILKRLHDALEAERACGNEPSLADYRRLLMRAYETFVHSDAYTERVMRVHQRAVGVAHVPLAAIGRPRSKESDDVEC